MPPRPQLSLQLWCDCDPLFSAPCSVHLPSSRVHWQWCCAELCESHFFFTSFCRLARGLWEATASFPSQLRFNYCVAGFVSLRQVQVQPNDSSFRHARYLLNKIGLQSSLFGSTHFLPCYRSRPRGLPARSARYLPFVIRRHQRKQTRRVKPRDASAIRNLSASKIDTCASSLYNSGVVDYLD